MDNEVDDYVVKSLNVLRDIVNTKKNILVGDKEAFRHRHAYAHTRDVHIHHIVY